MDERELEELQQRQLYELRNIDAQRKFGCAIMSVPIVIIGLGSAVAIFGEKAIWVVVGFLLIAFVLDIRKAAAYRKKNGIPSARYGWRR